MNASPSDILKEARRGKNITQQVMSEMLGMSLRQYQKIEDGAFPKYKRDIISKIDQILGTNVYEILYEQNIHSNIVEEQPSTYTEKRRNLKNSYKPNQLMFYEIGAKAAGLHTGEILPVRKSEGILHISDLFKGSQYAIRISGNSMMPNYPPGAIIGIREIQDRIITPGSVYVIEKDNDLWIKRLFYKDDNQQTGIYECISDNTLLYENGPRKGKPYYPRFELEIDKIRKLFKVTGIYKPNELTVIN